MFMEFRPPLFWFTGLLWLILSSVLGLTLFLGMMTGTPLPQALRLLHVHGALIGGVAQIILGAMLNFIPTLLMTGRGRSDSHPLYFAAINLGTIGVLAGFWIGRSTLVAAFGLLVLLAFLALAGDAIRLARASLISPPLNLWFYGVALLALLVGLGLGEAMAFRLFPATSFGHARLAHIHLNLLGFVTLTIVGTMHNLFPTVLNARLHSPLLARLTFALLPLGVVVLLAGFQLTMPSVQIAAGLLLLAGAGLYGYNMVRTWMSAGRPRNAASDHLMMATFFLILAVTTGLLVSVNALWDPPPVPYGTLHLVAYTHLALFGFVFQTIVGALSHLLPITLAVARVQSNKKRGSYLAELTRLVEQWRPLQLWALNLGTITLAMVAELVWQLNLGAPAVQITTWISAGLLLLGFTLFAGKVGLLFARRPPE